MPEQILNRQATEYKKEKKYDLAIECLRKANELYPHSFYSYTRDNYERLVDMMVLAGKFKDARKEHQKLDYMYGTRLDELKHLQLTTVKMGIESERDYQIRVINPYIEEANSKEQYYWLLENIPEIAPKSFGGYRMMKKKKTDNYLKIVSKVKKTGNEIDKLKFWL